MPLTKADVIETAVRLHLEGDADALSMRKIATALDVSPMALYRHVSDKDEILLAVADAMLAEQTLPSAQLSWPSYLRRIAILLRTLLRAEPIVLEIFLRRPVTSPAAQHRLACAVEVLTASGFEALEAHRAYAAVHTYTLGFCALEQSRRAAGATSGPPPTTAEAAHIAAFVTEKQFMHGLRAIIAGLGAA